MLRDLGKITIELFPEHYPMEKELLIKRITALLENSLLFENFLKLVSVNYFVDYYEYENFI